MFQLHANVCETNDNMLFPVVRKLNAQLALVVVAVVILCCVSMVAHAAVDDDDLAGFPERPSMFRSPEELKEYLRALNEYFAIAGRPRSHCKFVSFFLLSRSHSR
jgi:hypothetical protein